MSVGGKRIEKVLQDYKAAVLAKDVNAYIALYDDNIRIFDMWQEWSNHGAAEWRISAEGWFHSLGTERVLVEDDSVIIHVADTLATLDGFIKFTAQSAEGAELRSLARLVRKERPDGSPLKVREFVSHDSRHRFGGLNHACLGVRNVELQVREPVSGHAEYVKSDANDPKHTRTSS